MMMEPLKDMADLIREDMEAHPENWTADDIDEAPEEDEDA